MTPKIYRCLRYDWPLHVVLRLTGWLPDNVIFLKLRGCLAKPFFGSCGENLRLGRGITFYNPSKIHLSDDIYIAFGCWFMAGAEIEIGNEVQFGPYCVLSSSIHKKEGGSYRYGKPEQKPIHISNGSWLAAHVVVGSGVVIGEGCAVGANSVVNRSLPSHTFCAGSPAKVIRSDKGEKRE